MNFKEIEDYLFGDAPEPTQAAVAPIGGARKTTGASYSYRGLNAPDVTQKVNELAGSPQRPESLFRNEGETSLDELEQQLFGEPTPQAPAQPQVFKQPVFKEVPPEEKKTVFSDMWNGVKSAITAPFKALEGVGAEIGKMQRERIELHGDLMNRGQTIAGNIESWKQQGTEYPVDKLPEEDKKAYDYYQAQKVLEKPSTFLTGVAEGVVPFGRNLAAPIQKESEAKNPWVSTAGNMIGSFAQMVGIAKVISPVIDKIPLFKLVPEGSKVAQIVKGGLTFGAVSGLKEAERTVEGTQLVADAIKETGISTAVGGVLSSIGIYVPQGIVNILAQPIAGMLTQVGIDEVRGKVPKIAAEEGGVSEEFKAYARNQLINSAMYLGFALKDNATGQIFKMQTGLANLEKMRGMTREKILDHLQKGGSLKDDVTGETFSATRSTELNTVQDFLAKTGQLNELQKWVQGKKDISIVNPETTPQREGLAEPQKQIQGYTEQGKTIKMAALEPIEKPIGTPKLAETGIGKVEGEQEFHFPKTVNYQGGDVEVNDEGQFYPENIEELTVKANELIKRFGGTPARGGVIDPGFVKPTTGEIIRAPQIAFNDKDGSTRYIGLDAIEGDIDKYIQQGVLNAEDIRRHPGQLREEGAAIRRVTEQGGGNVQQTAAEAQKLAEAKKQALPEGPVTKEELIAKISDRKARLQERIKGITEPQHKADVEHEALDEHLGEYGVTSFKDAQRTVRELDKAGIEYALERDDGRNLGGLNAEKGHTGANEDIKKVWGEVWAAEVKKAGGIPFRGTGDEMKVLWPGKTAEEAGAIREAINEKIDAKVAELGIQNTKHHKVEYGGLPTGSLNIEYGISDFKKGKGGTILHGEMEREADEKVEVMKVAKYGEIAAKTGYTLNRETGNYEYTGISQKEQPAGEPISAEATGISAKETEGTQVTEGKPSGPAVVSKAAEARQPSIVVDDHHYVRNMKFTEEFNSADEATKFKLITQERQRINKLLTDKEKPLNKDDRYRLKGLYRRLGEYRRAKSIINPQKAVKLEKKKEKIADAKDTWTKTGEVTDVGDMNEIDRAVKRIVNDPEVSNDDLRDGLEIYADDETLNEARMKVADGTPDGEVTEALRGKLFNEMKNGAYQDTDYVKETLKMAVKKVVPPQPKEPPSEKTQGQEAETLLKKEGPSKAAPVKISEIPETVVYKGENWTTGSMLATAMLKRTDMTLKDIPENILRDADNAFSSVQMKMNDNDPRMEGVDKAREKIETEFKTRKPIVAKVVKKELTPYEKLKAENNAPLDKVLGKQKPKEGEQASIPAPTPEAVGLAVGNQKDFAGVFKYLGDGDMIKGSRLYRGMSEQKKRNTYKLYENIKAETRVPQKAELSKPKVAQRDIFGGEKTIEQIEDEALRSAVRAEIKLRQESVKGGEADMGNLPMFENADIEGSQQTLQLQREAAPVGDKKTWAEEQPLPAVFSQGNDIHFVVTPNFSEKYPFRITKFVKQADGHYKPSGHAEYYAKAPAIIDAAQNAEYDVKEAVAFQRQQAADTFFSPVLRATESLKQERGTGEQMFNMITKTPGVKEAEWKWMGLDDFLKGKQSVTKAEIAEFVRQNQVKVEEVQKGDNYSEQRTDELDTFMAEIGDLNEKYNFGVGEGISEGEFARRRKAIFDGYIEKGFTDKQLRKHIVGEDKGETKFSQYTLPGGENYREVLLTLPVKEISTEGYTAEQTSRGDWQVSKGDRFVGNEVNARSAEDAIKTAIYKQEKENPSGYKSSHWSEPNVIAHVRLDDRTGPNGEKVLFIEEIQSDWAREARERGTGERFKVRESHGLWWVDDSMHPEAKASGSFATKEDAQVQADGMNKIAVPAQPFLKNWEELVLKRTLRMAAEEGYDRVSWINGAQTADRYDLSKKVSRVVYRVNDKRLVVYNDLGNVALDEKIEPNEIEKYIGKEPAKRLLEKPVEKGGMVAVPFNEEWAVRKSDGSLYETKPGRSWRGSTKEQAEAIVKRHADTEVQTLEGEGLKIGGEWAVNLYDRMIPKFLEKYGKKWNVKVEPINLGKYDANANIDVYDSENFEVPKDIKNATQQSIAVTPAMRESVMYEGQPMFQKGGVRERAPVQGTAKEEAARQAGDKTLPSFTTFKRAVERDLVGAIPGNTVEAIETPADETSQVAKRIVTEVFGADAQFFRLTPDAKQRGVTIGGAMMHTFPSRSVFINEAPRKPSIVTAVHEGLHIMQRDETELYNELKKAMLEESTPDFDAYVQSMRDKGYSEKDVIDEAVVEISGERFTDPDFLQRLAQKAPEAFKKLVEIMQRVLRQIKNWILKSNIQHARVYFRDLQRVDEALQKAVIGVKAGGGIRLYPETKMAEQREEPSIPAPKGRKLTPSEYADLEDQWSNGAEVTPRPETFSVKKVVDQVQGADVKNRMKYAAASARTDGHIQWTPKEKKGSEFLNRREKFYTAWKELAFPTQKLQDIAEAELGIKIEDAKNIDFKCDAVRGSKVAAAEYVRTHLKPIFDSITEKRSEKYAEVVKYLVAKDSLWRYDNKDGYNDAGYSREDAQAMVDFVEQGEHPYSKEIQEMAGKVWEYTQALRQMKLDHAIIDEDLYESLMDPYYVPLYRDVAKEPNRMPSGNRFTATSKGIMRLKGSESGAAFIDPVQNLIRQTHETIENATRADFFNALVDLADRSEEVGKLIREMPPKWIKVNTIEHRGEIDQILRPQIEALAKDLGFDVEYKAKLASHVGGRMHKVLGMFRGDTQLKALVGATEGSVAHELGHGIHHQNEWLNGLVDRNNDEMNLVADSRYSGEEVPVSYVTYVRSKPEKVAEFISMYVNDRTNLAEIAPMAFREFEEKIAGDAKLSQLMKMTPTNVKGMHSIEVDNFVRDYSIPRDEDVISGLRGGKLMSYRVPIEVAYAIKNLHPEMLPTWARILLLPQRLFRMGTVGLNMSFFVPNLTRDNIDSAMNTKSIPVYDWLNGLKSFVLKDKWYDSYYMSGGGMESTEAGITSNRITAGRIQYGSEGGQFLDPYYWKEHGIFKGLTQAAWYTLKAPFRALMYMGSVSEMSTRLGTFRRAQVGLPAALQWYGGKGKQSAAAAVHTARQGTGDFLRKGSAGGTWNEIFPFTNMAFEGVDRFTRTVRDDPKRAMMKAFLYGIAPMLGFFLWNTSDEEKKKLYKAISSTDKINNWIIITGKNTWFKIPKSFSMRYVVNPIQMAWEASQGYILRDKADVFAKTASSVMPMDLSNMPPVIRMVVEPITNYDIYFRTAIEKPYVKGIPIPGLRFDKRTIPALKAIGKALNISPIMLQHEIELIGGGLAKDVFWASQMLTGGIEEDRKLRGAPVLKRFMGKLNAWNSDVDEAIRDINKELSGIRDISMKMMVKTRTVDERKELIKKNAEYKMKLFKKKTELMKAKNEIKTLYDAVEKK
jgi:hypothetical protein